MAGERSDRSPATGRCPVQGGCIQQGSHNGQAANDQRKCRVRSGPAESVPRRRRMVGGAAIAAEGLGPGLTPSRALQALPRGAARRSGRHGGRLSGRGPRRFRRHQRNERSRDPRRRHRGRHWGRRWRRCAAERHLALSLAPGIGRRAAAAPLDRSGPLRRDRLQPARRPAGAVCRLHSGCGRQESLLRPAAPPRPRSLGAAHRAAAQHGARRALRHGAGRRQRRRAGRRLRVPAWRPAQASARPSTRRHGHRPFARSKRGLARVGGQRPPGGPGQRRRSRPGGGHDLPHRADGERWTRKFRDQDDAAPGRFRHPVAQRGRLRQRRLSGRVRLRRPARQMEDRDRRVQLHRVVQLPRRPRRRPAHVVPQWHPRSAPRASGSSPT